MGPTPALDHLGYTCIFVLMSSVGMVMQISIAPQIPPRNGEKMMEIVGLPATRDLKADFETLRFLGLPLGAMVV